MKAITIVAAVALFILALSQPVSGQHAKHEGMKGMSMSHVLITHEVDDVGHWLAAWRGEDSRHKLFKAHGAMHVHVFTTGDNPHLTGLVVAVKDMDKFLAMLESEEGQAAAAEDGVRMDTLTLLVEAK